MKSKMFFAILVFAISTVSAQDLIVNTGIVINNSLSSSDLFRVKFTIKNVGGTTSLKNYAGVRISPNNNGTGLISLGFTSIESLSPGQVSNVVEYVLPLPLSFTSGTYYVYIVADNFNNIFETNESNNIGIMTSTIVINQSSSTTRQNIPYPILFVHGWLGDDDSWGKFTDSILNERYGWTDGGILDYCLNYDNNLTTGELFADFRDYTSPSSYKVGDYYRINFDIDANGNWWDYTCDKCNDASESNQSAIVKQGFAIQKAVEKILALTGKEKVILAGHSMGGLACREYLQRRTQSDFQKHIAKLFTCGTPNQGSNSTQFGLGFSGSDEKSEAVRDLRRSYSVSNKSGVYLFGGWETNAWIQNNILFYYHNVDVNCNGIPGDQIVTGLDYENYQDINYSCVIGTGDECIPGGATINSDGVVEDWSANLYNGFLGSTFPNFVDTFVVTSNINYNCLSGDMLHLELEKSYYGKYDIQGLDEPDFYDNIGYGHAYSIELNKLYYGVISEKSKGAFWGPTIDRDDYKFVLASSSDLNVNIYNIDIPSMTINIFTSSNLTTPYYSTTSNGEGNIVFNLSNVPSGTYYFEIAGAATSNLSWLRAYGFQISSSAVGIEEKENQLANMKVYPNPSIGIFNVFVPVINNEGIEISISNLLGEEVYSAKTYTVKTEIDLSKVAKGIYFVKVSNRENVFTQKIIIE